MKTLLEKLKEAEELTKKVIAENPSVTTVWYELLDIPMEELRSVAKQYGMKIEYRSQHKKMGLLFSTEFENCTIFCYSKQVKVTEHLVIDEAIENV